MLSTKEITTLKLEEFRRNERMTRAELEAMKLEKFRDLVRYASERSPYYAQLIADRGIDIDCCVLGDFPPLTKATLMAEFDRIVTDRRITRQAIAAFLTRSKDPTEQFLGEFRVIHTSGSSGEVGYFVYSPADWARGSAQAMRRKQGRSRVRKPRRFGRLRFAYYGAIGGHHAGITMTRDGISGATRFSIAARYYEVNDPLSKTIRALNRFQPDMLKGYTGALTILAAKQREGLLHIAPTAIDTGGEGLSATDKKTLEETFGCEVTNGYGSSEHMVMGFSVAGGASMLLRDDDLIYEPFEDYTLVTNLFNFTLPLIRYRMGDVLRAVAHKTFPDLPYLEINSLVGRTEMIPKFVNEDGVEDFISPHTINEVFVAGVSRFQMQLTGPASFDFVVCLDAALTAAQGAQTVRELERHLREILHQKRMANVRVTVRIVDHIPVNSQSRKFQLIVAREALV